MAALWFHIHKCPFKLNAWPNPLKPYIQFLNRVIVEKREEWKKIGIFDMILLSKKEIPPNFGLLYSFQIFWNTSTNAFCLPFGMMRPTLHDVAAITDLPWMEMRRRSYTTSSTLSWVLMRNLVNIKIQKPQAHTLIENKI